MQPSQNLLNHLADTYPAEAALLSRLDIDEAVSLLSAIIYSIEPLPEDAGPEEDSVPGEVHEIASALRPMLGVDRSITETVSGMSEQDGDRFEAISERVLAAARQASS